MVTDIERDYMYDIYASDKIDAVESWHPAAAGPAAR